MSKTQNTTPPSFLDPINSKTSLVLAHFIARIPGIPVDVPRSEALEALAPIHQQILADMGWTWHHLRRAEQVHGTRVALVGDIGTSFPVEGADALVCSGVADCMLGIYVADCAALWFYDPVTNARGLAHSGKAGTQANMTANVINSMKAFFGTKAQDLIVVVSPCIRPPDYEYDIPTNLIKQLLAAGVPQAQIHDCGINTASDTVNYYSYRAELGKTGRMFALFGKL